MISIVIPAYNEEKNIALCLESLYKQETDKKFEVIVVNNNSNDCTEQEAAKFANKLNLRVIKQTKKGRGAARMAGFSEAKGEIILSTDADTIHPTNWIEVLVNSFDGNTVAVTGPCKINDCGFLSNTIFNIFQPTLMRVYRVIFGHYFLSGFNFAIKKEAYHQVHGFDENLNVMEDIDLSFQVSQVGKIKYVGKNTVIFSGRRFKRGVVKGLLEYLSPFLRYYLKKNTDVELSDPR